MVPRPSSCGDRPQPRQSPDDRSQGQSRHGPHPGYFAVTWRGNMWANINRSGHGNEYHPHPWAYWSAVYYVADGGIADDLSLDGKLEIMDPRGPPPAMNAPHLGVTMPGGQSAGATERVPPKSGRLVMFDAPGATLSRHRRAHLHRHEPQPVGTFAERKPRRTNFVRQARFVLGPGLPKFGRILG